MRRPKSSGKGSSQFIRTERLESRQLMCSTGPGVFVNAGGSSFLDAAQNSWDADTGFTGGTAQIAPFHVNGTTDQALYNTRRAGANFDFNAETDSGGYTLTLLFAEPAMLKPGMRVFNVFAEGKQILKNFDLVAAAGPQTAISKSFPVTVTNNELDLHFQGVINNAIISAIELVPLPIAPLQPSALTAKADSSSQVTLHWTENANNETGFEIDRSPDGKSNWQNIGAVGTDEVSFQDTTAIPGTTYYYRVKSVGVYGESTYTSSAKAATPGIAPSAITLQPQLNIATTGSTDLRIDVGGGLYKDTNNNVWLADTGATGGTVPNYFFPVTGTADVALYKTRRYGNFSYSLPADDGNYTLNLYFTDPVSTAKNQRVFNVSAEGQPILTNFDIFAAAGFRKAITESAPVIVTGGQLNLTFTNVKSNAIVSAIELVPSDTQTAAPDVPISLSATGGNARVDLAWGDNSNNEAGFEIDRQGPNDPAFVRIATVPSNVQTYADTGLPAGTTYQYEVRAINNFGNSDFTDPQPATTTAPVKTGKITWTKLTGAAQSPVGRTEAETATVNGKLYCFGGYTDSTLVPKAVSDVFDPATGTWAPLPNMPVGETHAGTATDGRFIYMAGGYTGPGGAGKQIFAVTNVYKFDTQTNTWSNMPALPAARGAGALVLLGRTLHFIGGTDIARKDQTTHWSLNLDDPTPTWQLETPMLTARNHLGGVALNGKIYVVAGQQHQDPNFTTIGNLEIWDPTTGKWTTAAPLPLTRSHIAGATFVDNGKIIVMGGDHTYLHDVNNISSYDPATNKWTDLTPLPIARSSGCGTVINGVYYYATGNIGKYVFKGVIS